MKLPGRRRKDKDEPMRDPNEPQHAATESIPVIRDHPHDGPYDNSTARAILYGPLGQKLGLSAQQCGECGQWFDPPADCPNHPRQLNRAVDANLIADLYEVPRDLVPGTTPQEAPETAQMFLPPTQGPAGPEKPAGASLGPFVVPTDADTKYIGTQENPVRLIDSPNQTALNRTEDDIWFVPWDATTMTTGDRGQDYTHQMGEFHPTIRSAIEHVRAERVHRKQRDILNGEGLLLPPETPAAHNERMRMVADRLRGGEPIPMAAFADIPIGEAVPKPRFIVNHGSPGVPTVHTPMALHFAGTVDTGDLIVIKSADGYDLLSLRVRGGKLEARYYETDVDDAASEFLAFLKTFQPPAGPHRFQEFSASGNTCHYPGCTLTDLEHQAQQ